MRYIPWDFKYYAKLRGGQILSDIVPVMTRALDETSFFLCAPAAPSSEARRTNATAWVRRCATSVAQLCALCRLHDGVLCAIRY